MHRSTPRRMLVASVAVVALCALLRGGDAAARPAAAGQLVLPRATPAPAWPNDGAVDAPVHSTGCGQAPATAPGTTGHETLAVNPATDEGYSSREYWIHVPR